MAEDAWQPFAKLISRGDAAGVVAALEPLDEVARRRLTTQAERPADEAGSGRSGRHDAAQAAQSGTGGPAAGVRQWWLSADVASAAPPQAHDVQVALEAVLAAGAEDDRRRLLALLELLRRLAAEADAAIRDPRARAWLQALPPRSKGGRAARGALAVTGDGAQRSRAALRELDPAAA